MRTGRRLAATETILGTLARHTRFVEDEIDGLAQLIRPGAICVDIGAEYGLYTQMFSRLAGPRGRVYSFEPQPDAYRILRAGLWLSGAGNVESHRLALGESSGTGKLSVPRRRGLPVHGRAFLTAGAHGLGPNTEFAHSREVSVDIIQLDNFLTRPISRAPDRDDRVKVSFIKADVEGAELAVLRGASNTINRDRPSILLEIETRHLEKYGAHGSDVVKWLVSFDYDMRLWIDGRWRIVHDIADEHRNYLFTPSSARIEQSLT